MDNESLASLNIRQSLLLFSVMVKRGRGLCVERSSQEVHILLFAVYDSCLSDIIFVCDATVYGFSLNLLLQVAEITVSPYFRAVFLNEGSYITVGDEGRCCRAQVGLIIY